MVDIPVPLLVAWSTATLRRTSLSYLLYISLFKRKYEYLYRIHLCVTIPASYHEKRRPAQLAFSMVARKQLKTYFYSTIGDLLEITLQGIETGEEKEERKDDTLMTK